MSEDKEHDDEWFAKESKNLSPKQIAQEFLCDFAASGETFLSPEDIESMRSMIRPPLERWGPEGAVWVWKYALAEHKYVISADVSRGDAFDYSTFVVIDTNESEVVAEYKGKIPPDQFAVLLNEAGMRYGKALLCPENNTYGYAVVMKLQELGYSNLYYKNERDKFAALYGGDSNIHKAGFNTNSQSRAQALTKLEEVLRNRQVRMYSSRIYDELKTFIWKGSKAQAQKGHNDDLVMALAIGIWLYDTSPHRNKHASDLNDAMLKAFGVNSNSIEDTVMSPFSDHRMRSPFRPSQAPPQDTSKERKPNSPIGDFDWLLK